MALYFLLFESNKTQAGKQPTSHKNETKFNISSAEKRVK